MRFAHLTNFVMGGAITVAYEYNKEENSDGVIAAFSFCNPEDFHGGEFTKSNKSFGRNKAEGRFLGGQTHEIELIGSGIHESVMVFLTKDFMNKVDPEEGIGYSYDCIAPLWLQGEILSDLMLGVAEDSHADCHCWNCDCK
jgi:hypothetical protein